MNGSAIPQFVYPFGPGVDDRRQAGVELLGGKGASLAEMSRAGFPVPPGFTIASSCCAWVEQHDGQWPPGLEAEVRDAVQQLEQQTERRFGAGPRPLLVAVRSGAAVSMPGMMDTILNCGLNPSLVHCAASTDAFWNDYAEHIRQFAASVEGLSLVPDASIPADLRTRRMLDAFQQSGRTFPADPWEVLRQAINAVFASWHSKRARTYRQHHDIRGIAGTAVNVQAMFPSERSGVLFTIDPNQPESGEMILEASWGLGEAVVSGAVTPDIYAIDRSTLRTTRQIPGSRPGSEPALDEQQQREIAELGRRIEAHFNVPSDIEWGICDGRVALLQTRKIRGLEVLADAEAARQQEITRLTNLAGCDAVVWVIHNLSETLPAPTPLTWDLVSWLMSAQGGYGQMYRLLGHRPSEQTAGQGFLELIAGRIYADPRRAAQFHFGRLPFEYEPDAILLDRTALDRPPTRFNLDRTDSLFFFRLPGLLVNTIRAARQTSRLTHSCRDRFLHQAIPKLERFLADTGRVDLTALSKPELIRLVQSRRDFVLGEFAAESLLPGYFAGLAHDQLRQLLCQLFGPVEGDQLSGQLVTGLEGDITVEQNCRMFDVASGQGLIDDFLQSFGHRAVNEMELSQPRWREDRPAVERMIERFRGTELSPRQRHDHQSAIRREAEANLPSRLARAGGSSLRERVEAALRNAQQLLPFRELGKYHLMRGYDTLRAILVELGRRWDLGRDVFYLRLPELSDLEQDRSAVEARIAERKLRWRSQQQLSLPDVIDSRDLADLGRRRAGPATEDGIRWVCRTIAVGFARGKARIVHDPSTVMSLDRDDILVCSSTDPGWTPLFVNARGLIVERGGVLSHGAIVARDFGIPAVVLERATELIPDGAQLELDANAGTLTVLPKRMGQVESSPGSESSK